MSFQVSAENAHPSLGASVTVGELGENETLRLILPVLPKGGFSAVGSGDDAAILQPFKGGTVLTTDTMFQGPDFRLAWSSGNDLGRKAVTSNIADVIAMGARPRALLVAIGCPPETPVQFLLDFAAGVKEALAYLSADIGVVGGDLTSTRDLSLAITAIGEQTGPPVLRSGAVAGQTVAVFGRLGVAATGIRLLFERARTADGQPDALLATKLRQEFPELINQQLAPMPDLLGAADVMFHNPRFLPSAMLDVSDGLVKDAARIARDSGVVVQLDIAALGVFTGPLGELSPYDLSDDVVAVLSGGEDHALLATFGSTNLPSGFQGIGTVLPVTDVWPAGTVLILDPNGEQSLAEDFLAAAKGNASSESGWDAFSQWDGVLG